jgi:hypothetical protein
MNTLVSGDARAIEALCSRRDDVTAFLGWGGHERGWEQVGEHWDWAGQQFKGGPVTYQNLTTSRWKTRHRMCGGRGPLS